MKSSRPLAYILLGTPDSGRRSVLADLIVDGLEDSDRALTYLPESEPATEKDAVLGEVRRWRWAEQGGIETDDPTAHAHGREAAAPLTHVFFVAEGTRNPVDQIEALLAWLRRFDLELGRVITVIDCQLAHRQPALTPWFDACVHFSDVVLLARREGVPNKWMSDFQTRFRSQFIPAVFEMMKAGRVKNPALVLEPEARRVTQVFEEEYGHGGGDLSGLPPETEVLYSGQDEDEEGDPDDQDEEAPAEDPYFARKQSGSRVIELPDVRNFLPGTEG